MIRTRIFFKKLGNIKTKELCNKAKKVAKCKAIKCIERSGGKRK